MRTLFFILCTISFCSCNPLGNDGPAKDSTARSAPAETSVEAVRTNPKRTPVAAFEQTVPNDLNKWFFKVHLYETKQRFVYRLVMQYEALNEERNITFPDLHMDPQPQIQKGSNDFEAIIGFLDNKGSFKEYIKVFAQDGNLQMKTLKHYAVYSK